MAACCKALHRATRAGGPLVVPFQCLRSMPCASVAGAAGAVELHASVLALRSVLSVAAGEHA
eukprot:CAMPEP_0171130906 /NCGR_PEP_ID=MMETSP0766_2-20121228/121776_1 /TAXON_ID=439317 /ORGANISM="Gambierdiscus australes, Strain CAWD 149" /LENGTH=61 /DNA_ID=CAMNT_0011594173 /DNA_START=26 /DNA_END=211 /DNA_ORIENTATION=+